MFPDNDKDRNWLKRLTFQIAFSKKELSSWHKIDIYLSQHLTNHDNYVH